MHAQQHNLHAFTMFLPPHLSLWIAALGLVSAVAWHVTLGPSAERFTRLNQLASHWPAAWWEDRKS
ncbi:MAG: hypothetical protein ACO3UO_05515, partial [Burkholderiaceae bacterium]